jgi:hypothetical protein
MDAGGRAMHGAIAEDQFSKYQYAFKLITGLPVQVF